MNDIKLSKTIKIALLGLILLSFLILSFVYGNNKVYFYEDEVLSYTLANRQNGGFMDNAPGLHYAGSDILGDLLVDSEHRFDYGNVSYNQSLDAHPVLYYDILHTISSIGYGKFSKWYGIGINIVSILGILIGLYFIASFVYKDSDVIPLAVTAGFGFSLASMRMVCFVRMYGLLTLWGVLFLLIHVIKLEREELYKKKILFYVCVTVVSTLGILTHYYFLVFAFFVSAFYCIFLLIRKEIKNVVYYVISMALSFGLAFMVYPHYLDTLLGYETSPLSSNSDFVFGSLSERISKMVSFANTELMNGKLKWVLMGVIVYAVYALVRKKVSVKDVFKLPKSLWMIILVAFTYFGIITLITPYLCDRYVWPAFPLFMLLIIPIAVYAFEDIFKSKVFGLIILVAIMILPLAGEIRSGLYDVNMNARIEIAAENGDVPCAFLSGIAVEENVFELSKYSDIYTFQDYKSIDENLLAGKELVVYLPEGQDVEECFVTLSEAGGFNNYERLYVASYSTVYKFMK